MLITNGNYVTVCADSRKSIDIHLQDDSEDAKVITTHNIIHITNDAITIYEHDDSHVDTIELPAQR